MQSMRDKIMALKGKNICVQDNGEGGLCITKPIAVNWNHEIVEVGEDYFMIKIIVNEKVESLSHLSKNPFKIYAINFVRRIDSIF